MADCAQYMFNRFGNVAVGVASLYVLMFSCALLTYRRRVPRGVDWVGCGVGCTVAFRMSHDDPVRSAFLRSRVLGFSTFYYRTIRLVRYCVLDRTVRSS